MSAGLSAGLSAAGAGLSAGLSAAGADAGSAAFSAGLSTAGVAGVAWSTIMGPESRTIAVAGKQALEAGHLPEIGTRVLALLRELAAHQVTYVRLQFEAGAVLGAMIGRHCLFALAEGGDAVRPVPTSLSAL